MTIQYRSDTLILFLMLLWHGYCLMGNAKVYCHIPSHGWDVSHGTPIRMVFLWTRLCFWYMHQTTITL